MLDEKKTRPPPSLLLPLNEFTFQPARKVLALVRPTGSLKWREISRKELMNTKANYH